MPSQINTARVLSSTHGTKKLKTYFIQIKVLYDVMPCSLVRGYGRFEWIWCLQLQSWNVYDEKSVVLYTQVTKTAGHPDPREGQSFSQFYFPPVKKSVTLKTTVFLSKNSTDSSPYTLHNPDDAGRILSLNAHMTVCGVKTQKTTSW
jgi:hypothetical protein